MPRRLTFIPAQIIRVGGSQLYIHCLGHRISVYISVHCHKLTCIMRFFLLFLLSFFLPSCVKSMRYLVLS